MTIYVFIRLEMIQRLRCVLYILQSRKDKLYIYLNIYIRFLVMGYQESIHHRRESKTGPPPRTKEIRCGSNVYTCCMMCT